MSTHTTTCSGCCLKNAWDPSISESEQLRRALLWSTWYFVNALLLVSIFAAVYATASTPRSSKGAIAASEAFESVMGGQNSRWAHYAELAGVGKDDRLFGLADHGAEKWNSLPVQ